MTVRDVILSHGHFAHSGDPDGAGEAWSEAGFGADEVAEWLAARCFSPTTSQGAGDFVDTVAFKVSDGHLRT